jgi:hypothetical protein
MSEDPTSVADIVDAILDSTVPDAPPEVATIVRIRAATRRVLEAELVAEAEEGLLRLLARRAARTVLPLWALDAMLVELAEPELPPGLVPNEPLGRLEALRRQGFGACPTCQRLIPSELHLRRQRLLLTDVERDRAVRTSAVPRELVR